MQMSPNRKASQLYSGRGIVRNGVCVNLDIPSPKDGQGVEWACSKQRSLRSCLVTECVIGRSLPQCAAECVTSMMPRRNVSPECDPCLVKKPFYFQTKSPEHGHWLIFS